MNWEVFIGDGEDIAPYDLTGKDLSVYLVNAFCRIKVENFTTNGNILMFTWEGKDQRYAGTYQLTLIENEGKEDMHTLDESDAFELVRCSCMEEEDNDDNVEEVTLSSRFDVLRVYPIVPEIGENGNWIVDGEDTGQPARGERGEIAEIAYVYFDVDGSMDLNCSIVAGDSSLERGFGLSDDGYLTLDGTVDGVTGNSPSTSVASFENLLEVSAWEYDGNGKKYFPEDKFEQAINGLCSVLYKGVIYHAVLAENRMVIFSSYYIPDAHLRYKNVYQFAVNIDTREVMENSETLPPLEESPLTENLDENTSFLLATGEGVRTIPVMGLLGELVNIILDLQNRVSELEQKIN